MHMLILYLSQPAIWAPPSPGVATQMVVSIIFINYHY